MELTNIQFEDMHHNTGDDRRSTPFANFHFPNVIPDRSSDREDENLISPVWKKPIWVETFGGFFSA